MLHEALLTQSHQKDRFSRDRLTDSQGIEVVKDVLILLLDFDWSMMHALI